MFPPVGNALAGIGMIPHYNKVWTVSQKGGRCMASIRELHHQLVSKERSAVEITQEALNRIQVLEPKLHSFLCVTAAEALSQAQSVDAQIAAGEEIGLPGWDSNWDQRQYVYKRDSYNLRLKDVGELCAAL